MSKNAPKATRKRRIYPKLWGYSVTRICYRLGQLGWNAVSARAALEGLLKCEIELVSASQGLTDGKNPTYKHRAAPLTDAQIEELEVAAGRTSGTPVLAPPPNAPSNYPDELAEDESLIDGARYTVTVNAYERDPEARRRCIAAHGVACDICKMKFGEVYGIVAEGFIHIHHLRPLSEVGEAHAIDPVKDLRPVCPNCHAVLHRRRPAYSIEDVRGFLRHREGNESNPAAESTS